GFAKSRFCSFAILREIFVWQLFFATFGTIKMKITHTEIYRFSIRMEPFVIATGTMDYAQNIFVRIYTDSGIYGVGECSAFPMIVGETQDTCLVLAQDFARLWKGKNPLALTDRLTELDTYIARNTTAKSAFDI